jgi:hypothetical protein
LRIGLFESDIVYFALLDTLLLRSPSLKKELLKVLGKNSLAVVRREIKYQRASRLIFDFA